ncbi:ABC transporter ATP-binding protein/permease [Metamycoplasma faucium]|uniref:ABC transporter ATP-binding protein/permease n=1 Tax=Metamycoplasma faucium TaxID=56142 RepID=A0ABZ2TQK2_9BACT
MHNSIDPLYSAKKVKDMSPTEKKEYKEKTRKIRKESFKKLIWYINYKKIIFVSIIILNFLSSIFLATSTFLIGFVVDYALGFNQLKVGGTFSNSKFIIGLSIMFLTYLFHHIFNLINELLANKASLIAAKLMRSDAYKALMKMPVSFFDKSNKGEIMSVLSNDIDNVMLGLSGSLPFIFNIFFTLIISLGFMFYYSTYLTLICLALFPILFLFVGILLTKAVPQWHKQQKRVGVINGYIEEHLAAQHLIKAYNQEKNINKEFKSKNDHLFKSSFKASLYTGIVWPYSHAATTLLQFLISMIGVIFALGKIPSGSGKEITVGILTSFSIYIRFMTIKINNLFENIGSIQIAITSATRIIAISKLKPSINEEKLDLLNNVEGQIEFKNVNFSYTNNLNDLQLKNASFLAKKGQVFAFVGPTGAGKTTIINLLSKFYLPLSGEILIDGYKSSDINEKSWRENISIVLQDTFLFKTSIMENLRYANQNASDAEIKEAAKISRADEFITNLENGYNEIILEGGQNLSQGQRQLLAITRAIIANKKILILDEATSNVDTRTEKNIQNAMLSLMKGKTSFIIAHRLSTIVNADRILVVNNGEIVEQGNHKELLAKKGFYEKLYNSSFSED